LTKTEIIEIISVKSKVIVMIVFKRCPSTYYWMQCDCAIWSNHFIFYLTNGITTFKYRSWRIMCIVLHNMLKWW